MISAKVIADSTCQDTRLTTLSLVMPMTLIREFNTHRAFSRNASSSRAVPVSKTLQEVTENPVVPIYWGKNQAGMQSYQEIAEEDKNKALQIWLEARDAAVKYASQLAELGVHKQYSNLLLDPFAWIRVVVSSTEWDNFFTLRLHETAKPEIRLLAQEMHKAMTLSEPVSRPVYNAENVSPDMWHLPYISEEERGSHPVTDLVRMSTARCARVSYNKHDSTPPTLEEDMKLSVMLLDQHPPHASPAEHQAIFTGEGKNANFTGWASYRFLLDL